MKRRDRTAFNAMLILSNKINVCKDCYYSKDTTPIEGRYVCIKKNKIVLSFNSCNKFTL